MLEVEVWGAPGFPSPARQRTMAGIETQGQKTQTLFIQLQGQVLLVGQQRLPAPHLGFSPGKKSLKRTHKTAFEVRLTFHKVRNQALLLSSGGKKRTGQMQGWK